MPSLGDFFLLIYWMSLWKIWIEERRLLEETFHKLGQFLLDLSNRVRNCLNLCQICNRLHRLHQIRKLPTQTFYNIHQKFNSNLNGSSSSKIRFCKLLPATIVGQVKSSIIKHHTQLSLMEKQISSSAYNNFQKFYQG